MTAVPESDIGPLVWVKSEIDLSCARAIEALESFAGGGDSAQLKFAATHIHQAQGALAIVGLDGVTLFAQTIEGLVNACERAEVEASPWRIALAQQGLEQLRHYLDDLAEGQPDEPSRLLSSYLELQAARGVDGASPSDLFFPDLSRRPPRRPPNFVAPAAATIPGILRRERARFQRGLLQFLRHGKGLGEMRQAIAAIEACQVLPAARSFWWAALGFFDALDPGAGLPDNQVKRLCGRIDGQMRRLITGSANVSERLMRDVLFQVARQPGSNAQAQAVREAFALPAVDLPDMEKSEAAAPKVPMLRDVREAVLAAKEDWERFCSGAAIGLPQLDTDTERLEAQAAKLNHPLIISLSGAVRRVALWLRKNPLKQGESVGMEVATALLLLENALDNFERLDESFKPQVEMLSSRLDALTRDEVLGPLEAPLLDEMSRKAQERLILRQVVREIQNNLNEIEQALDGFFRDPGKREALANLAGTVKQVEGALYILNQERAVSLLHQCGERIASFAEGEGDDTQFEEVADKLSALGFFVASIPYGTADIDALLAPEHRPAVEEEETEEEEAPEESIEQQLEQQKRWTQELADALEVAPEDEYLRDRLHKNLETLRQDASLAGDSGLEQKAEQALQQLAAASVGVEVDIRATLGQLTTAAPEPSAETTRLAESGLEEIDAELLAIFLEEAQEVLGTIGEGLVRSRANPHDHDVLTTIRRGFHTLKGSGRMVNLKELGEVAWAVEQVMNRWLQSEKDANSALHKLIGKAHDLFGRWVEQLEAGGSTHMDATAVTDLAEILKVSDTLPAAAQAPAHPVEAAPTVAEAQVETPPVAEASTEETPTAESLEALPSGEDFLPVEATASEAEAPPSEEAVFEFGEETASAEPPEEFLIEALDQPAHVEDAVAAVAATGEGATPFDLDLGEIEQSIEPLPWAEEHPVETSSAVSDMLDALGSEDAGEASLPELEIPLEEAPADEQVLDLNFAETPTEEQIPAIELGEASKELEPYTTGEDFLALDLADEAAPGTPGSGTAAMEEPVAESLENVLDLGTPSLPGEAEVPDWFQEAATVESLPVASTAASAVDEPLELPDFLGDLELLAEETRMAEPEPLAPAPFQEPFTTPEAAAALTPEETTPFEEDLPVDEILAIEEALPIEEVLPIEEALPIEEDLPPEEALPVDEALSFDEALPLQDTPPAAEQTLLEEETPRQVEALPLEILEISDAAAIGDEVTAIEEPPIEEPAAEEATGLEEVSAVEPPALRPDQVAVGPLILSRALYDSYVDEALGRLSTLRSELDRLPETPFMPPPEGAYRAAHTLAGISGTVGFTPVQRLAKAMEHLMEKMAEAEIGAPDYMEVLIEGLGGIEAMLGEVIERRMPDPMEELVARTEAALDALQDEIRHHHDGHAAPEAQVQTPRELPSSVLPVAPPPAAEAQEQPAVRLGDDLDDQLLPIFLEESLDLMRDIESESRQWHENPTSAAHSKALARLLHTLKGSARMAGAMRLGEIVHALETRLDHAILKNAVTPEFFDAYDGELDRINHILDALRSGESMPPEPEEAAAPATVTEAFDEAPAAIIDEPSPAAIPEAAPVPVLTPTAEAVAQGQQASLRVRASLIDQLVNQAGEMSIARARIEGEMRTLHQSLLDLTENVIRLRKQLREIEIQAETQMQSREAIAEEARPDFDPLEFDRFTRFQELTRMMAESVNDVSTVQHNLLKNLDQADAALISQGRLNRELAQSLMSVRMVPFNSLASRLHRLVRQTAKELGKKANLDIRGGNVELDRSVLERVAAPLEHLLRNAITHGIELPARRRTLGKSEIGEIVLTVAHQGNEVALELKDDGAGLDFERIRARALEAGLIEPDTETDEAALTAMIFQSGFTTAETLSEVAGRGVGMDVVKSETASLGGRIDVSSTSGQGSQFHIYLPLTLAVTQAVLVKVGTRSYAVPSSMVEQAREVKPVHLQQILTDGGVDWMGARYPYHYLAQLFGDSHSQPNLELHHTWLLLLKSGAQKIALHVDELRGNQEVVVKNIGPQLARVVGISGATVLGDGEVALIINPVALAAREITPALRRAVEKQAKAAEPEVAATVPTIMVVDDSLTVRKITSRLLEREGYQVVLAKDGVDALEQLLETVPDAMLVDIEMPRMDGFDLSRNIRADVRLKHVPIIMITSRTADKHRAYAKEIGVNHYLGKPYQEDELLALLAGYTHKETAVEPA